PCVLTRGRSRPPSYGWDGEQSRGQPMPDPRISSCTRRIAVRDPAESLPFYVRGKRPSQLSVVPLPCERCEGDVSQRPSTLLPRPTRLHPSRHRHSPSI